MIPNCKGCEEEFMQALEYQEQGLHLATMKNSSSENIGKKGHFFLIMVDDEGKERVG